MVSTSKLDKFYTKTLQERRSIIADACELSREDMLALEAGCDGKMMDTLDNMVENVIGCFPLPVGIATNFIINGVDRFIVMATEEASVVAAASNAARIARVHGGFTCDPVTSLMIAQVQVTGIDDAAAATVAIKKREAAILAKANEQDPVLVKAGGGAVRLDIFTVTTNKGSMLDVHLVVDCLDAMGANAVNTMAEAVAPDIEAASGGTVILRIISNLAVHRVARARAVFNKELLGGDAVVSRIVEAVDFAEHDVFRAVTHNKGIMNGVSAVVRATGNDTRAIEAGAHAFAAWNRSYGSLTRYSVDVAGNLQGEIALPVPVGVVGGATRSHPVARVALRVMEIDSASLLSQVIAAVGLAQNLAALRALATEGIQQGHMRLHARAGSGSPIQRGDKAP